MLSLPGHPLWWVLTAVLASACGGKTAFESTSSPEPKASTEPNDAAPAPREDGGLDAGRIVDAATPEPFVNAFGCNGVATDPASIDSARSHACTGISLECELFPSDLLLLLDRSAAMAEPWGDSSRWSVALDGISFFLSNMSSSQNVGLQLFSARGLGDATDCADETYRSPVVEIGPADVVAPQIQAAALARPPAGPPTLGPALRASLDYAESRTDPTTVVLITSGIADGCGGSVDALTARESSAGAPTGVIGMGAGSEIDALAAPLGRRAFSIGETDGPQRVAEALRGIISGRGSRSCQSFSPPPPPSGQLLDLSGTRLFLQGEVLNEEVPEVDGEANCALSASGGWYFTAESSQIAVCPCTCASLDCGTHLEILFACAQ